MCRDSSPSMQLLRLPRQFCDFPLIKLLSKQFKQPCQQGSWGQHGAHLGPTGPRWTPCWPHELCYLRINTSNHFGTPKAVNMMTKLSSSQLLVFSQNSTTSQELDTCFQLSHDFMALVDFVWSILPISFKFSSLALIKFHHHTVLLKQPWRWVNKTNYRKVSNIRRTKSQNLNDPYLVLKSSLPNPLKPGVEVENEDVVGAAPTGDAPTTSEWSTI